MTSLAFSEHDPLKSFLWDFRIVLVSTPSSEVDDHVSELKRAQEAINERHILWFVFGDDSVATNYDNAEPLGEEFRPTVLKRYFSEQSEGKTQVRLIGKDGGVKARSAKLDLQQLFALIDTMPMRQAEMRDD